LERLIRGGLVWVACNAADHPVGMVIASVREDAVYVEEMDVLAEHGRRRLGGRLLETVCTWAHGYAAVTLSTFRDVPWNGPFYRRHGFVDLPPTAWTPGMRAERLPARGRDPPQDCPRRRTRSRAWLDAGGHQLPALERYGGGGLRS
jgi:Acetyltransferase (GNAT) domain